MLKKDCLFSPNVIIPTNKPLTGEEKTRASVKAFKIGNAN